MTKEEGMRLVLNALEGMLAGGYQLKVDTEQTVEKSFGWVFFYNTREFIESGNIIYALAGNGPIIVNRHTAEVIFCGTNKPTHEIIEEYERSNERG